MGLEIMNAMPTVGFAYAYGVRSPTATRRRGVPPLGCRHRKFASEADISDGVSILHGSAAYPHGEHSDCQISFASFAKQACGYIFILTRLNNES